MWSEMKDEEEEEEEEGGKKKGTFHRFQRDSIGEELPLLPLITLPKKTFTYG